MLRRLITRGTLALALVLAGLGVTVGVTSTPAFAAGSDCNYHVPVGFFNYIDRTDDNFTGVTQSIDIVLDGTTPAGQGCDAPYEGTNTTCLTTRLVVWYRPGVGFVTVHGPWVRSCWTPQKLASGWGGWLHRGDYVNLQIRAEQDGSHTAAGQLDV